MIWCWSKARDTYDKWITHSKIQFGCFPHLGKDLDSFPSTPITWPMNNSYYSTSQIFCTFATNDLQFIGSATNTCEMNKSYQDWFRIIGSFQGNTSKLCHSPQTHDERTINNNILFIHFLHSGVKISSWQHDRQTRHKWIIQTKISIDYFAPFSWKT